MRAGVPRPAPQTTQQEIVGTWSDWNTVQVEAKLIVGTMSIVVNVIVSQAASLKPFYVMYEYFSLCKLNSNWSYIRCVFACLVSFSVNLHNLTLCESKQIKVAKCQLSKNLGEKIKRKNFLQRVNFTLKISPVHWIGTQMLWWLILTIGLLEFDLYSRPEYMFSLASHNFIHMKQRGCVQGRRGWGAYV